MEGVWKDASYGFRVLLKSPAFSLVAVATLALGIGANTAIFSVVNAVLLRPLPYQQPERIMALQSANPQSNQGGFGGSAPADFVDWRAQSRTFEKLAAYTGGGLTLQSADRTEVIPGSQVTEDFFPVFRVAPLLGRTFSADEFLSGSPKVAVLSHRAWRNRFGGDPGIIDKTLTLAKGSVTVIGVMPPDFKFPYYAEVWKPFAHDDGQFRLRATRYLEVVGRLADGETEASAAAEMGAIAGRLEAEHPKDNKGWTVRLLPLRERLVKDARPALLVLLGAVGCVLLIACANVANLLLARAAGRRGEMAVRLALGATRGRLIRQLLAESVVLALLGGAAGLLLAAWGVESLVALLPADRAAYQFAGEVRLDASVLLFTVTVSLLTGILFGLAPGWQATRADLAGGLKEGGRGFEGRARARGVLIVAETALALVLLVGAGLLLRSFSRLLDDSPGYDPRGLIMMPVNAPLPANAPSRQKAMFYREVMGRVAQAPGVASVALTSYSTFGGLGFPFNLEGQPLPNGDVTVKYSSVSPNFFRALGVPLKAGREFADQDTDQTPLVFMVNQALARQFFAGGDPVGRRISLSYLNARLTGEIVGVAGDVRQDEPGSATQPEVYAAAAQLPWFGHHLVIRSAAADPLAVVKDVNRAIRTVDPNQSLGKPVVVTERLSQEVAEPRLYATLLGLFALVALLLAAVGMYGVMAYSVAQRTREVGIRMALGAQGRDVVGLIVGQGMKLTAAGVAVGLTGALALSRVVSGLLYGVSATDPLTFGGVGALLLAVALVACYLPARRATKVDPLVALRQE